MEYIIDRLSALSPFNQVDPQEIKRRIREESLRISKYEKNQLIYIQGEQCDSMDIVLKGAVDIQSIDHEGNMVLLARFAENQIIGVNLLFSTNSRYPFSVTAVEDTEIIKVSKELLLDLSKDNLRFTEALLVIVSDKALSLANWITHISMKPLREKILDYIQLERRRQGKDRIILSTSKKEIAERLGVQRTSLSRELQKMKNDGLLTYDRNTITLLNH